MTVQAFDYFLFGTHVVFGPEVSLRLGPELQAMGLTRPIVLTSPRMAASTKFRAILDTLQSFQHLHFGNIPEHSSISVVETIREKAEDFVPDCIIAVGGGSVSDSAKALAMLMAEGGRLADHATVFRPPSTVIVPPRTRPKLPIISVPTTASGAEATPSFAVLEEHEKVLFWNRSLSSSTILIDPVLCDDVPMSIMRFTAMNGIAHCLEGLYSRNKSPVSDAIALQAMGLFIAPLTNKSLPEPAQREALLLAGHLSGMALSMARSCLHHAICHVIGARHGAGHGAINTVMLPHTIRFNESVVSDDLSPVLAMIEQKTSMRFDSVSDWITYVIQYLDLPSRLSVFGVAEEDLAGIATQTMTERGLAFNPRPVLEQSQIEAILHNAL